MEGGEKRGAGSWSGRGVGHGAFFVFLGVSKLQKRENTGFFRGGRERQGTGGGPRSGEAVRAGG